MTEHTFQLSIQNIYAQIKESAHKYFTTQQDPASLVTLSMHYSCGTPRAVQLSNKEGAVIDLIPGSTQKMLFIQDCLFLNRKTISITADQVLSDGMWADLFLSR